MAETTCRVASMASGGGATGVVYHRMTRNAATSTASAPTTATGASQEGLRDTGFRIARLIGVGRLIRSPS